MEDPRPLQLLREAIFDEYQHLAPRPFENVPVRVVDITRHLCRSWGSGHRQEIAWPRPVNKLADLGAAAIAFDILFAEPDRMSPRMVIARWPALRNSTPLLSTDANISRQSQQ